MLSLVDWCLLSIRDNIENRKIQNLDHLPRSLSQSILDTILMHLTIGNPDCSTTLSSPGFLKEISSLSTQCGRINDQNYLSQVAHALSTTRNGSQLGDCITKLALNVYRAYKPVQSYEVQEINFRGIIDLIAECPRLISLGIRVTWCRNSSPLQEDKEGELLKLEGGLLNKVDSSEKCRSIIENVKELILFGFKSYPTNGTPLLKAGYPILEFKNLVSLDLKRCSVDEQGWLQLHENVKETLECLSLKDVGDSKYKDQKNPEADDAAFLLKIPLLNLKRLKLNGSQVRYSKTFFDNLSKCTKVEYAFLVLAYSDLDDCKFFTEDEETLKALSRIEKIRLDLQVDITFYANVCDVRFLFDDSSRFKLVSWFRDKITRFKLRSPPRSPSATIALEHALVVCTNLTHFHFKSWPNINCYSSRLSLADLKIANAVLYRFFSNKRRTSKLRNLHVAFGHMDYRVVTAIFENCLNLDSLNLAFCSEVRDEHLIEWARRGAKPRKVVLECSNVTENGVIPILINSGDRLKMLSLHEVQVTNRIWLTLIDKCRHTESVWFFPKALKELALSKFFNGYPFFNYI